MSNNLAFLDVHIQQTKTALDRYKIEIQKLETQISKARDQQTYFESLLNVLLHVKMEEKSKQEEELVPSTDTLLAVDVKSRQLKRQRTEL
jgi:hypothetical protein